MEKKAEKSPRRFISNYIQSYRTCVGYDFTADWSFAWCP